MNSYRREKISRAVEIAIILASALFIFHRAHIGYCFNDEPFVISLAQRLYFGDMLLAQEWNTAQNAGVLVLPFYWLFRLFSSSSEGIIICFRYIYCFIWLLTCIAVYYVLQKKHRGAIFVFLYLIFFSPLDYMSLSYTSLSLVSCLLLCSLLYFNFCIKRLNAVVFSLFFSIVSCAFVLCYPYLAFFYVLALIAFLVTAFSKSIPEPGYLLKAIFCSLGFIAILLIIYACLFIFKGFDFDSTKLFFSYFSGKIAGNSSASHPLFLRGIIYYWQYSRLYSILVLICFCFFLFAGRRNALEKYRGILFAVLAIVYFKCQFTFCSKSDIAAVGTLNYQVLGIVHLGFVAYLFLKNKPRGLFNAFFIPGVIYAFCVSISTDTKLQGIAMALSVCGAAGIIFIVLLSKEILSELSSTSLKSFVSLAFSIILVFQVSSELYVKCTRQYWDEPVRELRYRIDCGAAKGLKTSHENWQSYNEYYDAFRELTSNITIENSAGESFLCTSFLPVAYVDANLPAGVYSAWSNDLNPELLNEYYSANPQKQPTIVFSTPNSIVHIDDIAIVKKPICYIENGYSLYRIKY